MDDDFAVLAILAGCLEYAILIHRSDIAFHTPFKAVVIRLDDLPVPQCLHRQLRCRAGGVGFDEVREFELGQLAYHFNISAALDSPGCCADLAGGCS
ncbi:hypothetical protein D3C73_1347210 [compost metagenome]